MKKKRSIKLRVSQGMREAIADCVRVLRARAARDGQLWKVALIKRDYVINLASVLLWQDLAHEEQRAGREIRKGR